MELFYVLFPTLAAFYFMYQAFTARKDLSGMQRVYATVSNDYVKYNREAQQLRKRNAQLLEKLALYEGK